ncbi:Transcription initiation factor TFIID subunit 13 [Fasciola gigantica]|uniref:Transcription initiation factor TFIID subunit 13 n=1 Tax=Fasciola gigantica TaxID=46835 RepID=A0A504Z042_FASGI|nr:Transcription initiation factor TFIID subunit 13 [Fasciola gigantica]
MVFSCCRNFIRTNRCLFCCHCAHRIPRPLSWIKMGDGDFNAGDSFDELDDFWVSISPPFSAKAGCIFGHCFYWFDFHQPSFWTRMKIMKIHLIGVKSECSLVKVIRAMMYAFGDEDSPLPETVAVLEEIAVKHIIDTTKKALRTGRPGKISVEDVTYLVRRDPKKFSRVKELLLLSEELRRARKAFEEDDYGVLK